MISVIMLLIWRHDHRIFASHEATLKLTLNCALKLAISSVFSCLKSPIPPTAPKTEKQIIPSSQGSTVHNFCTVFWILAIARWLSLFLVDFWYWPDRALTKATPVPAKGIIIGLVKTSPHPHTTPPSTCMPQQSKCFSLFCCILFIVMGLGGIGHTPIWPHVCVFSCPILAYAVVHISKQCGRFYDVLVWCIYQTVFSFQKLNRLVIFPVIMCFWIMRMFVSAFVCATSMHVSIWYELFVRFCERYLSA